MAEVAHGIPVNTGSSTANLTFGLQDCAPGNGICKVKGANIGGQQGRNVTFFEATFYSPDSTTISIQFTPLSGALQGIQKNLPKVYTWLTGGSEAPNMSFPITFISPITIGPDVIHHIWPGFNTAVTPGSFTVTGSLFDDGTLEISGIPVTVSNNFPSINIGNWAFSTDGDGNLNITNGSNTLQVGTANGMLNFNGQQLITDGSNIYLTNTGLSGAMLNSTSCNPYSVGEGCAPDFVGMAYWLNGDAGDESNLVINYGTAPSSTKR